MSELKFPPSSGYHGPVTAIYPKCGGFDASEHCASCGSTDVRVTRPTDSGVTATVRCLRCGRVTNIRKAMRYPTARYSIMVNGRAVAESDRLGLEMSLTSVLADMQRQSAEKTRLYYGRNYDSVAESMHNRNLFESTFYMIDYEMALSGGYVDGLEVGEEYNLPDFPVSIVRMDDSGPKSVKGRGRPSVDLEQLARDVDYATSEYDHWDYLEQFGGPYPTEEGYLMALDSMNCIEGVDDAILFVESSIDPDEFPMYDDLLARLKARREELAGPVSSKSRKPARKTAKPKAAGKPTKAKTSANRKSGTASRKAPARKPANRRR